jgi:uncharacterized protein (DUF433 family)
MIPDSPTMIIPLQADAYGTIQISGTRVTLDTVIARYHQGDSPETIHDSFDVLPVNDIYAVIAYYLGHRAELDAYLKRREEEGERIRQEIEANYTPEQRARHERLRKLAEEKRRERDS